MSSAKVDRLKVVGLRKGWGNGKLAYTYELALDVSVEFDTWEEYQAFLDKAHLENKVLDGKEALDLLRSIVGVGGEAMVGAEKSA